MSEGKIWIKLFGLASLIISESFPLMWKFNVAELNFGNATCSISMSPATGSLLLCEEVLNLHRFSMLFTCTPGDCKGSCFLIVLGVSRVWCFDFAVASHKCCWPSKGVKDCTHLCAQRPASSHTFPHLQSKLIGVVVLSISWNNWVLCKVLLQTCATFNPGFL